MTKTKLPLNGIRINSAEKRFQEVVVFVHNFGGSPKTLRKHIKFVNDLGFDAVAFELSLNTIKAWEWKSLPLSSEFKFGARYIWTGEIERILNSIAEKKIVYSFSFPSACALEAIARRSASDISAWVCDGGPFLDLYRSSWKLFTYAFPIKNLGLRALMTGFSFLIWGVQNYKESLFSALNRLPASLPILSVRGWQDKLVPPAAIEATFKGHNQLNLKVFAMPEAGHIDGIAKAKESYHERVGQFLIEAGSKQTAT